MTDRRQSIWICALTLLYAGFTPDQIQEAESGVHVYGPEEGFTTTDRDSSSAISDIITRCEACGFELPDKIWPTGRRLSGEDYATYDIEKLGIDDIVTWMDYIAHNKRHLIRFINVNQQLFSHRATLYEVMGHCTRRHGALLAGRKNLQLFKSYLHYRRKTSRGAGRKKKIRRRRKSKKKGKKKTRRRKKRTKRRH